MANIIDTTYFQGKLTIAQKSEASVVATLTAFIGNLETEYLQKLLGYELWKNYIAGIAVAPTPDVKWTNIRDGVEFTDNRGILTKWMGLKFTQNGIPRSPIANYIYFYWIKNEVSATTGGGEKKIQSKNSIDYTPGNKMSDSWVEMVGLNRTLFSFLYVNQDVYPEFFKPGMLCIAENELFAQTNMLGI